MISISAWLLLAYLMFSTLPSYSASSVSVTPDVNIRSSLTLVETARSASSFIDFVGFNIGNGGHPIGQNSTADYEMNTNYRELLELHVTHVRVSAPYYVSNGSENDPRFDNLIYLGSLGIHSLITTKLDPTDGYTIQPSDEVAVTKFINQQSPGAVEAIEGVNEHYVNHSGIGYDFNTPLGIGPTQVPDYSDVANRRRNGQSYRAGYSYNIPVGKSPADWITPVDLYTHDIAAAFRHDLLTENVSLVGPSVVRLRSSYPVAIRNGEFDDDIDLGNVHDYSYPYLTSRNGTGQIGSNDWLDKRNEQEAIYQNRVPLVMTETGYNTGLNPGSSVTDAAQAKILPRQLLDIFTRTAQGNILLNKLAPHTLLYKRAYVYELLDRGRNTIDSTGAEKYPSGDPENHFGLVSAIDTLDQSGKVVSTAFTKKPAYVALKNLMDVLYEPFDGTRYRKSLMYTLTGKLSTVHHVLLQKADGSFYLVLYSDVDSDYANPIPNSNDSGPAPDLPIYATLGMNQYAKHISVYSTQQSNTPFRTFQNTSRINLQIPDSPLIVKIDL